MNKKIKNELTDKLFECILSMETVEECYQLFEDLCTINEIQAIAQRMEVAAMLDAKRTYVEIAEKTGASTATISRVNRCLHYGTDGYKLAIDRVKAKKEKEDNEKSGNRKEMGENDMIGFDKLNDMQKKAVLQTEGPVLILAGAGSGKTGALTVRIAHLLETGVKPWNILAITFTNKAAKEMRERVEKLVGDTARDMWISTFHSTCVRILRREIQHLDYENQFSIYDSDDQEKIMREAFKRLNMSTTDKSFSVKGAMSIISHLKEEMTSWEDYAQHVDKNDLKAVRIAKVYQTYQKMLKENNALDFDDLIYKTVLLFRQFPDVLEKYQERFRYIMVDEYQDTNTSQYELVAMLAAKYKNLCVVGDDDQSIYGWRGANIRNILDFEKDFPDTTVIKLEQNYRSTKKILEAANAVIHHNQTRKDKTLWTENDSGSILHIYKADNEYDECRFVAEKILELEKQGKTRNQMAVLYRANAQSRAVEDQMVKRGIPYRLFGGVRFYERKEIRDILSYLKVLANPADTIALRRIINVPKRGIGETSLDKLAAFAEENGLSLYGALSRLDEITTLKTRVAKFKDFYGLFEQLREDADGLSVSELIDAIVKRTGYLQLLMAEGTDDALNRIQNIDEFVNKAAEYDKANPEGKLEGFLEDTAQREGSGIPLCFHHRYGGGNFPRLPRGNVWR